MRRPSPTFWPLLLIVVPAAVTILFLPSLGAHEQNLFAEWVGAGIAATENFYEFAKEAMRFGLPMLAIAWLMGGTFAAVAARKWRTLLTGFDAATTGNYRAIVRRYAAYASMLSLIIAVLLILTSSRLRALPPLGWTITLFSVAAASLLQYWSTVFAFGTLRRLYMGR